MRSRKSAQSHEMLRAEDKFVHPKILLFLLIPMYYTQVHAHMHVVARCYSLKSLYMEGKINFTVNVITHLHTQM